MSSGLADLTTRASDLVAAGDLAAAQELLDNALSAADPSPARASAELAAAAGLQARIQIALGEPHAARGWAAFAYSAATRLYGPSDPRTVAAAATLAAVLHRVGSHARAGRLYREVIIELTATDGPESLRVLAAHADLATVEYARGECQVARDRLQDAWELHREVYGDGHPAGIKMLARLGAMQRDCGQLTEGYENLALARELCRQYLPADHQLCAQVAALADAPPDPAHSCGDRPVTTGAAGTGPFGSPDPDVVPHPGPDFDPDPQRYPVPANGYPTPGAFDPAFDPASAPDPAPDPESMEEAPGAPWAVPQQSPPQQSPPQQSAPQAPPWSESSLPPAVPGFVSAVGTDDPASDRPASDRPAADRPAGVWSVSSSLPARRVPARLPVVIPRPARPANRRLAPAVFAGLLAVLVGAIIVVAGFALASTPEDDRPGGSAPPPASGPPSAPTGAPTAAPTPTPTAPGSPPTEVRLRDGRDRVTLTWVYPPGAEGPVVISGGRTRDELHAFHNLPAGTNSYIVYSLNPNTNYCFAVAVVYSVETVGQAKPVCTSRRDASPAG